MQLFDAPTTRAALAFERLIPALQQAFASDITVPPRHVHSVPAAHTPGDTAGTVLIMPAWNLAAGFMGIKTINIFPGNSAQGLPGLHATYLLYDANTGVPLALMDGDEITTHRTAGAAALGASFLAREDASTLLVLGTGRVARLLPAAFSSVRPIQRVLLWNHRPESAEKLAALWRQQGFAAEAHTDLEAATRQADIVSCATLSNRPLIQADWLAEGSHLDLIGSFTPQMREAAPACFAQARTFVDTPEALTKSGDLLDAMAQGCLQASAVQANLFELCQGQKTGRRSQNERTIFKAVGSALEDLTAAQLVWQARSPS